MSMQIPKTTKKIGPYQIGEQIGKGAFGTVYKVINIETASTVAIKQISLQNLREEEKKSIQMEIKLLKKLKHDNIVKYIDCISTETHLNIVLEYVESGSLASIIKKFGPFPESLVAIYTKQILTGLDYLHSQGVVHRDIKGANILTTKEGIVKLADFGVATKLSEVDDNFTVVGTPYWMAPEIIEMRGHVSTSCDIWSVGCTVIELLTGNPPYSDLAQYPALFRIVQDEHPPLPNGITDNSRDFLIKCFQKEPVLRIDAKGLLKHPWIRSQNTEVLEIINSPNNLLPEEVTNTIRLHMDKTGGIPLPISNKKNFKDTVTYSSDEDDDQEHEIAHEKAGLHHGMGDNSNILHYENFGKESPQHGSQIENDPKRIFLKPNPLNRSQSLRGSNKEFASIVFNQENQTPGNFNHTNHLDKKQMMPTSAFGTLIQEGSFLSVDNHEGLTNTVCHVDSIKQLKMKGSLPGENRTIIGTINTNSISKKDNKFSKELNEIMNKLFSKPTSTELPPEDELINGLIKVTEILKEYPRVKSYFMKQFGITNLMDILDQCDYPSLIHATLQLINQLIENDQKLQEQSCIFGLLPYMIKFTQAEYPREIRVEAAYYLGQLAFSNQTTLQMFIASGGFKALVELLDLNYDENKDLICLAIDSLSLVFDMKILLTQHLCKILFKLGIFQRLVLIINNLYTDPDENMRQYLYKALNLMINFAKCEDSNIRLLMSEDEILLVLQIYLKKFEGETDILFKTIKIIRFISSEPSILNKLESIGILPGVIRLISKITDASKSVTENEEPVHDLLRILFYMSKLNGKRQESIVLNGGIPLLINLTKNSTKIIKKIAVPILCHFVQTSDLTRKKLWEYGGPKIFLDLIDDDYYQPKILDTICQWFNFEQDEVESHLLDHSVFTKLIEVFKNANKTTFQQIVPIYEKFIELSERFGTKLSKSSEFLQEIVERLGVDSIDNENESDNKNPNLRGKLNNKKPLRIECTNPSALVRKELLDILVHLCLRHSNPRSLLDNHNLYAIILQIMHVSQDDMVILYEIATQLMQIYSTSGSTQMYD